MRTWYFVVPRTGVESGGVIAELETLAVARSVCPAQLVTYERRERETAFLLDVLAREERDASVFVISHGYHVPRLLRRLRGRNVVYHAHSAGYGFGLPPDVPIITVSRNTMAYWGRHAPNALIYYLPNVISGDFRNQGRRRDLDVLVQRRKSSRYLLHDLVPALRSRCRVEVLDSWVEDLGAMFNRSKVYLYDSSEHWVARRVTEGFGLPPLEALACGCVVFSSVNDALADYLDPGFNCHKLRSYARSYDVERIVSAVESWERRGDETAVIEEYREPNVRRRFEVICGEIDHFFDEARLERADIESVRARVRRQRIRTVTSPALVLRRLGRALRVGRAGG